MGLVNTGLFTEGSNHRLDQVVRTHRVGRGRRGRERVVEGTGGEGRGVDRRGRKGGRGREGQGRGGEGRGEEGMMGKEGKETATGGELDDSAYNTHAEYSH